MERHNDCNRTALSRVLLVAVAMMMTGASLSPGTSPDRGADQNTCPPNHDYGTPWFINQPINSCCNTLGSCAGSTTPGTALMRYMPETLISREDAVIVVGEAEWTSLATTNNIPHQTTNSCMTLAVDDGGSASTDKSGANAAAYMRNLITMAQARGLRRPLGFRQHRFEFLIPQMLDTPSAIVAAPTGGWRPFILRTPRSFQTFIDWHTGVGIDNACPSGGYSPCWYSHCRTSGATNTSAAFYRNTGGVVSPVGADTDDGCDDLDDPAGEYAWTLYTQLYGKNGGGDTNVHNEAVYDVFYRGAAAARTPIGVMADLTNDNFIDWAVRYLYETLEDDGGICTGPNDWDCTWTGVEVADKKQVYTSSGESDRQYWFDLGDSLEGSAGSNTGNPMTLTEAYNTPYSNDTSLAGAFSGPPRIREGYGTCDSGDATYDATGVPGCLFTWPYYAYGMLKLSRALHDHSPRIYAKFTAQPLYWACAAGTVLNAGNNYTSVNCSDIWDDSSTQPGDCTAAGTPHPACTGVDTCDRDCNEASMMREMQLNFGYLPVDLQGDDPNATVVSPPPSPSGGIGAGSGSGLTLDQMIALINATDRPPVWIKPIDTSNAAGVYGTPPKACRDPNENNPGTPLVVP